MGIIKLLNRLLFLLSLVSSIFLTFYSFPLPDGSQIVKAVKETPPQITPTSTTAFTQDYAGVKYQFTPRGSFEIYGLVVEQYDSQNWLDITNQKDPAQTKDLCLVWGENITTGAYLQAKYSHGEFTCFFGWDSSNPLRFNGQLLTNNHLIPQNETLQKLLKKILDNQGAEVWFRKTSTSLGDQDCEVVLVSEYKILKEVNPFIKNIKADSYKTLGLTTLLGFILFFI